MIVTSCDYRQRALIIASSSAMWVDDSASDLFRGLTIEDQNDPGGIAETDQMPEAPAFGLQWPVASRLQ